MGTAFLNSHSVISTTGCCKLLLTCLEKVFYFCSVMFTTENFECMVRLKKVLLKNVGHGCAKVAHCAPLGDVTSPTTVAHNFSVTCSEHKKALTAAPTSD